MCLWKQHKKLFLFSQAMESLFCFTWDKNCWKQWNKKTDISKINFLSLHHKMQQQNGRVRSETIFSFSHRWFHFRDRWTWCVFVWWWLYIKWNKLNLGQHQLLTCLVNITSTIIVRFDKIPKQVTMNDDTIAIADIFSLLSAVEDEIESLSSVKIEMLLSFTLEMILFTFHLFFHPTFLWRFFSSSNFFLCWKKSQFP